MKKYEWIGTTLRIPKVGTFYTGEKFSTNDPDLIEELLKRKLIKKVNKKKIKEK